MLELFRIAGLIDLKGGKDAEKELDKVDKKAEGFGSKLKKGIGTVAKWGAAVSGATAAAGGAMMGVATKAASATDRIDKMSQKLGMSREAFQQWDFILSQNGVNIESLGSGMKTLTNQVDELAKGGIVATDAFSALGITYEDLEGLSREQIFEKTIVALQGVEDETKRAAIANDLLGRSGQELAPLLNAGAGSVEELKEKAKELGLVLGDDAIDAGVKFTDTMDQLKRSFGNVFNQIGVGLMPIMQKFADWIIENMPTIQAIIQKVFDGFEFIVNTVVGLIQMLLSWLNTLFEGNKNTFEGIWEKIKEVFTFIYDYWVSVWEGIKAFWEENGQAILDFAIHYFTQIWETVETSFNAIKDIVEQILGYIVPWIQEKLEVLKQFWEENGEQIMQAVENAFEFIRGVIEFVMPIIQGIIKGAWNVIRSVFDTAISVIMGLVQVFSGLLTGDFSKIKEGLTRIWKSLWKGIKGVVSGAWDMLKGAFSGLWESISGWFNGLVDDAISWGKDLIKGFWEGIKGMGSWIASKIGGFIKDKIPGPVKKVLGIASPSKLMMEYGEDTGEGLAIGMEDMKRRIERAAEGMALAAARPAYNLSSIGSRPIHAQPVAQGVSNNFNTSSIESLLLEVIRAIREGKNIIMQDRVVGEILEPIITEKQTFNKVRRERFAT